MNAPTRPEEARRLAASTGNDYSKALSDICRQFCRKRVFWDDLAGEEVRHAELISRLVQAPKKDWVAFREGKIRAQDILRFTEHVKGLAWKAENDEIDLKSAVAHTLDLGKWLVEKMFFPVLR